VRNEEFWAGTSTGDVTKQRYQNLLSRLTPEMSSDFHGRGFWATNTIYGLALQHAAASPERVAVRDRFGPVSYRQLVGLADGFAAEFSRSGLRPGDRVAAWLSTRIEIVALLLACSRNGYVFCPSLHRNHTAGEIRSLLEQMHASAFVGEESYGADSESSDVFSLIENLPHLRRVFRLASAQAFDADTLAQSFVGAEGSAAAPRSNADDIVYLAFTSGTTGEPKGVMHSNNTLLANARSIAADWQFDAASIIYSLSPLSHNLGFGAMVLAMLVGGQLVLHDLPRNVGLLQRLRELTVTFVFGVPTHAIDLLKEIEASGVADLAHLKGFRISGAAVSSEVVQRLLAFGIRPQSGYGMTEACSHHYTLPDDPPEVVAHTSGRACPGYEVTVFSTEDQDKPVPVGTVGQVGGRGASLMLGYFDDQLATESAFNADGWFMTGDLGKLDAHGYLQITGRLKDVIIRGGHNIHPARIEMLAMRHQDVERAAAIAVKDERLGEKVCLVVMPRNGQSVSPEPLLAHLHAEGLSKYDMPEYFAQVDEIPLSASGKILKRALSPDALALQPIRWHG